MPVFLERGCGLLFLCFSFSLQKLFGADYQPISSNGGERPRSLRRGRSRRATVRRQRGVSRAAAAMWRLIARGTRPGDPHGALIVWRQWEYIWSHLCPVVRIPRAPHHTLRMRLVEYQGRPVSLPDGSQIVPGMLVGELHCNNAAILSIVSAKKINPYRAAREDLRCLARWVTESSGAAEVKAFYGVTLLGQAAVRLGFAARRCAPGVKRRLDRMFMTGLLLLYSCDGLSRLDRGKTLRSYPQEVWLSRKELLLRYGGQDSTAYSDALETGAKVAGGADTL